MKNIINLNYKLYFYFLSIVAFFCKKFLLTSSCHLARDDFFEKKPKIKLNFPKTNFFFWGNKNGNFLVLEIVKKTVRKGLPCPKKHFFKLNKKKKTSLQKKFAPPLKQKNQQPKKKKI